jgi:hypothetical protein
MSRYARRTDKNQGDIISGIRKCGYRVFNTSASGDGFPDMVVVGRDGRVALLFENKMENEGKVTPAEMTFMMQIVQPVYRIVTTPEQVVDIMFELEKG